MWEQFSNMWHRFCKLCGTRLGLSEGTVIPCWSIAIAPVQRDVQCRPDYHCGGHGLCTLHGTTGEEARGPGAYPIGSAHRAAKLRTPIILGGVEQQLDIKTGSCPTSFRCCLPCAKDGQLHAVVNMH